MKKSKAIIILLCALLVLAGVSYLDYKGVNEDGAGSASDIKLGLDLAGGVSITYQTAGDEVPSATDMADTINKLQKRVENYSTEAIVYQEGLNRINIEIPGVSDQYAVLEELGKPGSLYFISQTGADGSENYAYQTQTDENGNMVSGYFLNKTIEELQEDGSIILVGTDVKTASGITSYDDLKNAQDAVELDLTDEGAKKFATATEKAYNAGESIAIYYDGKIVSAPTVQAVITNGIATITGMENAEAAENLASTIRIGGLSLELEVLHSKVVGAQLGIDAISTSIKAAAVGLAIVIVFMIAVYFISGVAASLGLLIYVSLIVMLLNGFDMTLTLSGIAGIILSIGMAVDANVIIFARIREELATGKSVETSIKTGFDKALSAILDGNITTLIAAGVLFFLAPGTIKGFAETLALGIVLSMFTSLVVVRWILNAFYALGLKDAKWYGVAKELKPINFLSKKALFFGVSIACILGGFVMMGVNKSNTGDILNYGLEFKGGTATTVTFEEEYSLERATAEVVPVIEEAIGGSSVQVQPVEGTNEVVFKTNSLTEDQGRAVEEALIENFGVDQAKINAETISSTISNEMKADTIIAVAVAIVFMLIYIRVRFKDLRFGISSIAALMHDVLVVLAFYALAKVSIGNTFIACMLTIVGYSINATIVIFDRVRENMAVMTRNDDLQDVVNRSITQTLSRSIFTSLTTFVMVACLYVFGVTSIREFALPLMVGIICGAYSSVCVTGGLWYVMRQKFPVKGSK